MLFVRTEGERTVKTVLEGKLGGGKQKKDLDYVVMDLRNMGIKRWRTRAMDGTEWVSVLNDATGKLKGLQSCKRKRRRKIGRNLSHLGSKMHDYLILMLAQNIPSGF